MQLSRQTVLSLELLMLCASKGASGSFTLGEAATLLHTTKDYLSQIMKDLGHYGYLVGQRGRNGGIRLARPASQIAIYDLLILLEPKLKLAAPLKNKNACPEELVIVRHVQNAMLGFFGALHGVTLSQLAHEAVQLKSDGYLVLDNLVPTSAPKSSGVSCNRWAGGGAAARDRVPDLGNTQIGADLRPGTEQ